MSAERTIERLVQLVQYLAEFAAEQGADFGLWADSDDEFDAELFREVVRLPSYKMP